MASIQRPLAVLLDRDGVINFDSPDYILTPEQWVAIPDSLQAIARLTKAGIAVAIVSNQSGLGRGMINQNTFNAIHAKMMLAIEEAGGFISHVSYCPHAPGDGCDCRKPKPAMVADSLTACEARPDRAIMIGDSVRDMQAAHAAGVAGMLVQSGYGDAESILQTSRQFMPSVLSLNDLAAAVDVILEEA
ncbi:MAG: D-glycero-beta-D-manno-heptose 1,7-bisphosphate 7-phosphatase [Mariprofundus sp.]|nr:D-glycero-beta-D-manno-heptose 1,7-bisphosphate 7-phosphatase [Mariprofundus sp.]